MPATRTKRKRSIKWLPGQKENGRVDWKSRYTKNALEMAKRGIALGTIANATGMTKGQVAYRMAHLGIKLREYRRGASIYGEVIVRRYKVEH